MEIGHHGTVWYQKMHSCYINVTMMLQSPKCTLPSPLPTANPNPLNPHHIHDQWHHQASYWYPYFTILNQSQLSPPVLFPPTELPYSVALAWLNLFQSEDAELVGSIYNIQIHVYPNWGPWTSSRTPDTTHALGPLPQQQNSFVIPFSQSMFRLCFWSQSRPKTIG